MALNTNLFEFISPNGGDSNYVTYEYTHACGCDCLAKHLNAPNSTVFLWRKLAGHDAAVVVVAPPPPGAVGVVTDISGQAVVSPPFPMRAYRYGHTWRMSNPHDVLLLFLLFLLVLPQLLPQVFAKVN